MRGFPLQDTGPGMNELLHDLQVEEEEERRAKPKCTCAQPHLRPWWWCAVHGEVTVSMD
jgi:hypothetical protein